MKAPITLCIVLISIVMLFETCKKEKEPLQYKIENGCIGILYSNTSKFGVSPNLDKDFKYSRTLDNLNYYLQTGISSDNMVWYAQALKYTNSCKIHAISTKDGSLIEEYNIGSIWNDFVVDDTANKLYGLGVNNSNSGYGIYELNLKTKSLFYLGDLVNSINVGITGRTFLKDGKFWVVTHNGVINFDLTTREIFSSPFISELGSCVGAKYDFLKKVIHVLTEKTVNGKPKVLLYQYNFNTMKLTEMAEIPDGTSVMQATLCFNFKQNQLTYYTKNNTKVTIFLDDYSSRIETNKEIYIGCQYLHNNVEISLKDVEF